MLVTKLRAGNVDLTEGGPTAVEGEVWLETWNAHSDAVYGSSEGQIGLLTIAVFKKVWIF